MPQGHGGGTMRVFTTARDGEAAPLLSAGAGRFQCPLCGRPIALAAATVPGHCGAPDCARRTAVEAWERRVRTRRAELDAGRAQLRAGGHAGAEAARQGASPDAVALGVVPWQGRPSTRPAPERIVAFLAHLDAVIAEAFAADVPQDAAGHNDPSPEPPRVSAGCATCQGHCCLLGAGRMAFVEADTIRMHRARIPGLTPEGARAIYADALPETSTEEGCLFQTERGCALPRERRAGICNRFRCWQLEMSLEDAPDGAPILFGGIDDGGALRKTGAAGPAA